MTRWAWLACAALGCGADLTGGPPIAHPPVREVPSFDLHCGSGSPEALALCVDRERLAGDVREVAKPRPPGSDHHRQVRELCAVRLRGLGFQVEIHDYGSGANVIGTLPGFSKPAERVIVSAHYDQLPGCPGADDNASGVAAMLESARVLAGAKYERSLVAACWDESERGGLGSRAYAKRARERGETIAAALVLESVGFSASEPESQTVPDELHRYFPDQALWLLDREYRGDFLLIVSDDPSADAAAALGRHAERSGQASVLLRLTQRHKVEQRGLHRRDQASFWDEWQRGVLLTDTGRFRNPRAGCVRGEDTADALDFEFATRVTRATVAALAELLVIR